MVAIRPDRLTPDLFNSRFSSLLRIPFDCAINSCREIGGWVTLSAKVANRGGWGITAGRWRVDFIAYGCEPKVSGAVLKLDLFPFFSSGFSRVGQDFGLRGFFATTSGAASFS